MTDDFKKGYLTGYLQKGVCVIEPPVQKTSNLKKVIRTPKTAGPKGRLLKVLAVKTLEEAIV